MYTVMADATSAKGKMSRHKMKPIVLEVVIGPSCGMDGIPEIIKNPESGPDQCIAGNAQHRNPPNTFS
jgi:hypothetical protein